MSEHIIETTWTDKDWDKFAVWIKGVLQNGPVTITFTKKDGTERVMKCTLEPSQLPKVELKEDTKPRKESTTSMRVFDLEKNEWRSFTIKSVKRINIII
jgi:WYL_2, Sm-like SH3 beta-barrel fold